MKCLRNSGWIIATLTMMITDMLIIPVLRLPCHGWMIPLPITKTIKGCPLNSITTILQSTKLPYVSTPISNNDSNTTIGQGRVQEMLNLARQIGPVGVLRSKSEQDEIYNVASQLQQYTDIEPAKISLTGIHNLVYSAAPGGSSGKIGPFSGRVTQEFINDITFINSVELGPLKIALTAERIIKNDDTIKVNFKYTTIYLLGQKIIEKETGGGGVWKYIFAGTLQDTDGTTKLIRVMQTPSLFILEQSVQ
jgi:hypothetical protein